MTPPQSPKRRSTLTDDELGGLIRSAADAWRPPPERLGRRSWADRANLRRATAPARIAAAVGVAIAATVVLAVAAPYLGLLRQIGTSPSTSPSNVGATPSAMPTPLPKLVTFGDPLPPTRLVVGDYQYEILDLSTGTLSSTIGPGAGCDAVARTSDGSIACTFVVQTNEQGAVHVRLALVDATGHTTQVLTLADYQPDVFPQAAFAVAARTAFAPGGSLVYVSHVVRHQDTWGIAVDLFQVPSGSPVGSLQIDEIPATGGVINVSQIGSGQVVDPELVPPMLQIAPDGRHLVARSDLAENQGPAVSYYWSIALGADGRMSDPKAWPSGAASGTLDECLGDGGFASASAYYLLCGPGIGTTVRRVDLAGAALGDTAIPAELQTYPLTTAFDPHAGALFLWSGVNRSIARIDLATGALTGPITAPVASAPGPLGALGALAGGISDWIAPSATAKIFLQAGMVVSADGSRVYALGLANAEPGPLKSTGVFVFDGATLRQVDHWSPTADYVSLALSPDGTLLYAAGASGDLSVPSTLAQASVTAFDTATGKVRLIAGQLGSSAVFFSRPACSRPAAEGRSARPPQVSAADAALTCLYHVRRMHEIFDQFKQQLPDVDPAETQEWLDSLDGVVSEGGAERARFIIYKLLKRARQLQVGLPPLTQTRYVNTISTEQEPPFPGDEAMEHRIRQMIRWNALAMVLRANTRFDGIGGHLSTYASAASLYEVGFNHFFRGRDDGGAGDQIFFQGHAAPGIYARAFLEGRLSAEQLDHFRRETGGPGTGLPSYPHPRTMPDFWQFPTVSMGLGPMTAVYQARFNRYLAARGITDTSASRVWAFVGDGEMDEPEALGALGLAAREGLDNLTFVVNCNLQRLDGPVRGNGKIIQELEATFRGAGWHVIKVIWAREWDDLLARDTDGVLLTKMNETLDGDYQKLSVADGAYIREHFFGPDPRLGALVAHLSDDALAKLRRGGHDYRKVYAAYAAAVAHTGAPVVILAKTVKGWALGPGIEGRNVTHQAKKLTVDELKIFRDRLELPIPDEQLADAPYVHPGPDSPEVAYLLERRRQLGGLVPRRLVRPRPLPAADDAAYGELFAGADRPASTTMAFSRLVRNLVRDPGIGRRIVPIIPDEARTFGMDPLFKEVGIYNPLGQRYTAVDQELLLSYREATDGQILEEGITEAGAMADFTAAGTSYATHGEPMIPFYTFYSMFGFQRTGDQIWAFGDARGRGFMMGATAGRTTLTGEGLQHDDGHSHILASTLPNVLAYDPAFAYELAIIVREGIRRMYGDPGEDIFYYLTLYNENWAMPPKPDGVEEGVLRGLYRVRVGERGSRRVQLLGSGSILHQVLRAADLLAERYDVAADVWSVPSFQQLRNDALSAERWNRLHPEAEPHLPYVVQQLGATSGPIIAATDYLKALPEMVARWIDRPFTVLGTDGFGRSDTREALRMHFEVSPEQVAYAALHGLCLTGAADRGELVKAIGELGIDPERIDPREA